MEKLKINKFLNTRFHLNRAVLLAIYIFSCICREVMISIGGFTGSRTNSIRPIQFPGGFQHPQMTLAALECAREVSAGRCYCQIHIGQNEESTRRTRRRESVALESVQTCQPSALLIGPAVVNLAARSPRATANGSPVCSGPQIKLFLSLSSELCAHAKAELFLIFFPHSLRLG